MDVSGWGANETDCFVLDGVKLLELHPSMQVGEYSITHLTCDLEMVDRLWGIRS